jgi:hypothetical protein
LFSFFQVSARVENLDAFIRNTDTRAPSNSEGRLPFGVVDVTKSPEALFLFASLGLINFSEHRQTNYLFNVDRHPCVSVGYEGRILDQVNFHVFHILAVL